MTRKNLRGLLNILFCQKPDCLFQIQVIVKCFQLKYQWMMLMVMMTMKKNLKLKK